MPTPLRAARHAIKPDAIPTRRVTNVGVWPAPGGGLLISLALPDLGSASRRASNLPNFFFRICALENPSLTIPYVTLDDDAAHWLAGIIGDELDLPDGALTIAGAQRTSLLQTAALFPLERDFRAAASLAKDLILAEAAEAWNAARDDCSLRRGYAVNARDDRRRPVGALASGAAIQCVPSATQLRSGEPIRIASPHGNPLLCFIRRRELA